MPLIHDRIEPIPGHDEDEDECAVFRRIGSPISALQSRTPANWREQVQYLMSHVAQQFLAQRVSSLERELEHLGKRVQQTFSARQTTEAFIETFAPEPYEAVRPIRVFLQPHTDGYLATLVDANINASGDTDIEAVWNLKDMMISLYERLQELKPEDLGPGPMRQLAVLQELLRRRP